MMDITEKIDRLLREGKFTDTLKKIGKQLAAGPREDWPGMKKKKKTVGCDK